MLTLTDHFRRSEGICAERADATRQLQQRDPCLTYA
ncbi:protein of unknown function [Streptomyces sp. KY70]|nr:protein of unknown function [Streptomyces sp. KY70]